MSLAQNKSDFTLADIFKNDLFSSESVGTIRWMNDGQFYSAIDQQTDGSVVLVKKDILSGETVEEIVSSETLGFTFTDYAFSADEQKIIFPQATQPIYRRSSKSVFHVYDLEDKSVQQVANGEHVMYATFSPDASKIGYVKANNLFIADLKNLEEVQITFDGQWNQVINGNADWVYEEEFAMSKAFKWSPNGRFIAFWKFDESEVKEYNMQKWGDLYPQDYQFKYPKAGEKNATVRIEVFDSQQNKIVSIDTGAETDMYIPRIYWTPITHTLSILRLNRLQNHLEVLHANVLTGESLRVYEEQSETYVDINYNDNLKYLKDGKTFVFTSEQTGFKHIFAYDFEKKKLNALTQGSWEVTDLLGVDEERQKIYFLSTMNSPLERHAYTINLEGQKLQELTEGHASYSLNWSPDYQYFIRTSSSTQRPNIYTLHENNGSFVRELENNSATRERLENYELPTKEFFSFTTSRGDELNGYMIKPNDFDENQKYPVLMYVYGGPGSQTVRNTWHGTRDFWHMYLANQGYIIASIDNRGTGARGKDFKHLTYGILGKYEVEDQISGGQYLADLPYTDANRIGIWGWSYGGYMSSLSLFIGNDVFKSAIAVAPVTSWRYYDTIYTERYMSTPQQNGMGYDAFSPNSHIEKLKGNFFLIHGTGDDNVHFQNSVEMVNRLIAADKQFDSFYYPNRNHGISGGNTSWHLYNMMTEWIINNL